MKYAYYNENNPKAAAWLRELIRDGLIADGDVDERSIADVTESDLHAYAQCHFFAGIGGWSLALRLAGWPDDRPVWTGSCPCQDFSNAGKQARFKGDRDFWPVWFKLISKRRPYPIFGEQVDDSPEWYDRTAADLESDGYACAASVIPACAVGIIQERFRLYFAAYRTGVDGRSHDCVAPRRTGRAPSQPRGLFGLHVVGRRWGTDEGAERLPTLVRNAHGISAQLAGLGNAIVPPLAAAFILASEEAADEVMREGRAA